MKVQLAVALEFSGTMWWLGAVGRWGPAWHLQEAGSEWAAWLILGSVRGLGVVSQVSGTLQMARAPWGRGSWSLTSPMWGTQRGAAGA